MEGTRQLRLLFTADLHGSLEQYNALAAAAIAHDVDVLLIGGDLFLKGGDKDPAVQMSYWKVFVVPILRTLKQKKPALFIYVIMGNADSIHNIPRMQSLGKSEGLYTMLNSETVRIPGSDFYLFGYCYIPVSPHRRKDWEKFDTPDGGTTVRRVMRLDGYFSGNGTCVDVKLRPSDAEHGMEPVYMYANVVPTDCIQLDLEKLCDKSVPADKCIWMVHTPPHNTGLDLIKGGSHVGSVAVLKAIGRCTPLLTLHGHIHETVDESGRFVEVIGQTSCYASGNKWKNSKVACILVSTAEPNAGQRILAGK